jgi:hypothetical protein
MHNYWRGPQIASTVNSFLLFYNDFQRKYIMYLYV